MNTVRKYALESGLDIITCKCPIFPFEKTEHVFIPSRKISKVDEIRYISKTNVKAVEVREDKSILVYYYFQKIDGKWLVNLPKL